MPLTKIALIGANGNLGPSVLSALFSAPHLKITILTRSSSTSTYPPTATVLSIPDSPTHAELVQALQDQDALITTFGGSNSTFQIALADAAAEAGVQRFIPADFGSCDSSSARALELVPLYERKREVREYLQGMVERGVGLSWTSLVCGHFFDYGLESGLLQFDMKARTANVFDGGEVRWSASTLAQIGRAVVALLGRKEETRNRMLYMQSFAVTQNDVLRALEEETGGKWEASHTNSEDYIKQERKKLDADPKDHDATENLVSVVGIVDAFWEGKKDFANELLGLKTESLRAVVREVVKRL